MNIDYGLVGVAGAILALLYAVVLFGYVRRQDPGNSRMVEIATAVRQGADAFLNREYRVIAPFAVVIVILIYVFIDLPLKTNGATAIGFAIGAALSAIAGNAGYRCAIESGGTTRVAGAGDGTEAERPERQFSQGEYRSALLALTLALDRFLEGRKGFRPIIILDDAFSELDARVRAAVASHLLGMTHQIFITTTERLEPFQAAGARVMEIRAGQVVS